MLAVHLFFKESMNYVIFFNVFGCSEKSIFSFLNLISFTGFYDIRFFC